ncbi:S-layer homology domain-containing protein [Paenibacillus sp. GCM10027626]|uniref:S-layer homology domain-containing protein n=1 Tax=Paenibacillus sp. GCM10027626 TaxID=3273411 RepID=UPI0036278CF8
MLSKSKLALSSALLWCSVATGFAAPLHAEGKTTSNINTNDNTKAPVSELRELPNGKKVLYVEGKPFQTYGVQIRVDTQRIHAGLTNEQISAKELFRSARELNANVVQIPISWGDIEPSPGVFDWTNVEWAISEAKKAGLKMEVLWFGLDVCGTGWSKSLPKYIVEDTNTYSRVLKSDGTVLGTDEKGNYYGNGDGIKTALSREDPDTLAREQTAVTQLMAYLADNDRSNVVIGFQVENEPSIVQHNPKINEIDRDYSADSTAIYEAEGYTDPLEFSKDRLAIYLNKVAGWVKSSAKPMYTRVNFITAYDQIDEDVAKMRTLAPNVDFIGIDTYGKQQWDLYNRLITDFSIGGNVPHIAEQEGAAADSRQKIMDVLAANGVGAEMYRLDRAVEGTDNFLLDFDGKDARPETDEVRGTFGMLNRVMPVLATKKNGNDNEIQYFNAMGRTDTSYTGSKSLNGVNWTYATKEAGIGVAMSASGDTVLLSAKAGSFTAAGPLPSYAESGSFDGDGVWRKDWSKPVIDNGDGTYTVKLYPYEVVRLSSQQGLSYAYPIVSATMGGNALNGHGADQAIDGDWDSFAQSDSNAPWDLTADLGAEKKVHEVKLVTTAATREGEGTNLALGAQVTMSAPSAWENDGWKAVDGDLNTWAQSMTDLWGMTVDLGESKTINQIVFTPVQNAYARKYDLLVSADGEEWTVAASETKGIGTSKTYDFVPVSARYVKIDVKEQSNPNHAIKELAVYDTSGAGETANGTAAATGYVVQASTDGTNWTTVAEEDRNNGDTLKTYSFEPVMARYIRIHVLTVEGGNAHYGHGIREIGVFGFNEPPVTPPVTPPINVVDDGAGIGDVKENLQGSVKDGPAGVLIYPQPEDFLQETQGENAAVVRLRPQLLQEGFNKLLKKGDGAHLLSIVLPKGHTATQVELPFEALARFAQEMPAIVLAIHNDIGGYDLPLKAIDYSNVARTLGVPAADMQVRMRIQPIQGDLEASIKAKVEAQGYEVKSPILSFSVTVEAKDKKPREIKDFGTVYVPKRLVVTAKGDKGQLTAVTIDPATGELSYVPSTIQTVDGVTEAIVYVTHDSLYAIVHPSRTKEFEDIQGHWAQRDIALLASKLLVKGQTERKFAPDLPITRAEFTSLLVRTLGLGLSAGDDTSQFLDVPAGTWYTAAVNAAVRAKLVSGTNQGLFKPDELITREQMALMLRNALAFRGAENDDTGANTDAGQILAPYKDKDAISAWARAAVSQSVQMGLMTGRPGATIQPGADVTRAEAAVVVKRLLDHLNF